jgi:hypothetical protein
LVRSGGWSWCWRCWCWCCGGKLSSFTSMVERNHSTLGRSEKQTIPARNSFSTFRVWREQKAFLLAPPHFYLFQIRLSFSSIVSSWCRWT